MACRGEEYLLLLLLLSTTMKTTMFSHQAPGQDFQGVLHEAEGPIQSTFLMGGAPPPGKEKKWRQKITLENSYSFLPPDIRMETWFEKHQLGKSCYTVP